MKSRLIPAQGTYLSEGSHKGFSLLEIMVALAILSISVVAVIQLFSTGLRGIYKAEQYTKALILSESLLEEAIALDGIAEDSSTVEFDSILGKRTIQQISTDKTSKRYRQYTITVYTSWPPGGRLSLSVTQTTNAQTQP